MQTCLGPTSEIEHSKLLGVIWNSHTDQLLFKFDELNGYVSNLLVKKWSVLKVTAKIFNALSPLGPFAIKLKLIFRKLCAEKVE